MFARLSLSISLLLLFTTNISANPVTEQVNDWRQTHEQQIVDQNAGFLAIPNVAADKTNIRRNADYIGKMLKDVGMHVERLELEDSNPVIFAEKQSPGATQTIMMYMHFDGQPVNPDNWASDPSMISTRSTAVSSMQPWAGSGRGSAGGSRR